MEKFKIVDSVKVNPTDTVKCVCIKTKPSVHLISEDDIPHNFIKDKIYECARYLNFENEVKYTVIYKSDDYEDRHEGTKFFVTKGRRSSHFLDEAEFNEYFLIEN